MLALTSQPHRKPDNERYGEHYGEDVPIRALCADLIQIAVKDYAHEERIFSHDWSMDAGSTRKSTWWVARRWLFSPGTGAVTLGIACEVTGIPVLTIRRWAEHCHEHGKLLPLTEGLNGS